MRKYNSTTNLYSTLTEATIQEQTFGDETTTVAEYQVTDGSSLDSDGVANSTIVDPVGLGSIQSIPESSELASTGHLINTYVLAAGLITLISVMLIGVVRAKPGQTYA